MKTILFAFVLVAPLVGMAQVPWTSSTPFSQRNAQVAVRNQVTLLRNITRNATSYAYNGYDAVLQQFQGVRAAFHDFTATLGPQQVAAAGNDLAELDAGLNIIEEAFSNYQNDLAAGQEPYNALRNLCNVVGEATGVWLDEFNRDTARLRIGF